MCLWRGRSKWIAINISVDLLTDVAGSSLFQKEDPAFPLTAVILLIPHRCLFFALEFPAVPLRGRY